MQEHTDIGLSEITDGTSGVSITFATAVTTGSADAITTTLTGIPVPARRRKIKSDH